MIVTTIPAAQRALIELQENIPYNVTTSEINESILELDKILKKLYSDLSQLRLPVPPGEVQHIADKLLEQCCCIHWIARRIKGAGDYCPDCIKHNMSAGLYQGQIRLVKKGR